MKRFIFKSLFFIGIIYALGCAVEFWIGTQLKEGKRYFFQGDWHDLDNHNSEILFVGNSRTWVHVDPFFIQKKFNTTCEVVAQDGQDIAIVWLKLKEYLNHNQAPKELYLQFDPFFLQTRNDLYGIDFLRTCFFFDRVDLTSLSNRNGYKAYYRFVPLAAYNWKVMGKIWNDEVIDSTESYENTHGAIIQDKMWEGDWQHPENVSIDAHRIGVELDSIVMACKSRDIALYAIFSPQSSPSYSRISNVEILESEILRLEKLSGMSIPFINFNGDQYNDSTLFYNHMHMNRKGVTLWMDSLVNTPGIFSRFR